MPESQPRAGDSTDARVDPLEMAPHYYGGQAVIEGVMMRGADIWSVAVRRPDEDIYLETNGVSDLPKRHPIVTRPMIRGVFALGDSLAIGMKALNISARESLDEEEAEDFGSGAMGASMALALLVFVGIFIFLPSAGVKGIDALIGDVLGDGALFHFVESLVRIAIFLGYLFAISLVADIRRVFQYHGAEHKTIAAWEHGEVLEPDAVDRYSTLHVRCGTNFLIMVMLLALIVYSVAGFIVPAPDGGFLVAVGYHVALRIVLLPVIAGLAYEGLRVGARYGDNWLVSALMKPGLWLQLITTKPPTRDQIEVAIRAFEAVVPADALDGRVPPGLPSRVVRAQDKAPAHDAAVDSAADGAAMDSTAATDVEPGGA